jgi:AbiV family abortive infection protein
MCALGPALSLAALALEELAKLHAIDGLLFAKKDDHKVEIFKKALRSHSEKLAILERLAVLIANLSTADPRDGSDERFNAAVVESLRQLKKDGNTVIAELGGTNFSSLDGWKQKGLYVSVTEQGFIAPCRAVEPSLAKAVCKLAWRTTTTIDFLLKGGNLEKYVERARSVRAKLPEQGHQELERLGKQQFEEIFQTPQEDQ